MLIRTATLGSAIFFLLASISCGGGSGASTPPVVSLRSVTVVVPSASQDLGFTQQLKATANFSDGSTSDVSSSATWTSADQSIATVSTSGVVTAKANGSTTIQATYSAVSGTATITVAPPTSVVVSAPNTSRPLGLTQQFTATANFADGKTLDVTASAAWSTADSTVATVSSSGLVTTLKVGPTSIQASFAAVNGSTSFTVAPPALATLAVSIDANRVLIGSTHQLAVTGGWTDGTTTDVTASVAFQLTNPYIAGIDSHQVLTGITEGITSIQAASSGVVSPAVHLQVYSKARFAFVPDASRVNSYIVDGNSGLLRATTYSVLPNVQDLCVTPSVDRSYIVVSNYRNLGSLSGFLWIFSVNAVTGEVTPGAKLPQPAATGSALYAPGCAAFHPSGKFFYVADQTTGLVTAYGFDPTTGTATELGSVAAESSPFDITMDPLGRFLFISNEGSSDISEFAINSNTGALTLKNSIQSFQGEDIVSIDPSGNFAAVSARNTTQMRVYSVGNDGSFTLVAGSSRTVPEGPSRVIFSPDGSMAYFTGFTLKGSTTTDVVEVDSFNASTGALAEVQTVSLPAGAFNTPAIDPEGKRVYVADNNGGFEVYSVQADGTLAAPLHFRGAAAISGFTPLAFIGGSVQASASTTHVYAGMPASNVIAEFDLNTDGTFASATHPSVAAGQVSSIATDYFGRFVFAVAPQSQQPNTFEYSANAQTGELTSLSFPFSVNFGVPQSIAVDRDGNFAYITDSFASPETLTAFERLPSQMEAFGPSESLLGATPSIALDPFAWFVLVANRDKNSVSGFQIQTTNGDFSQNPFVSSSYSTDTGPALVYIEPLGRFVYTANQGSGDVSIFQVAMYGGFNTLTGTGNIAVGSNPSALAADPFGKYLFVGLQSGALQAYAIDASSGALSSSGTGVTASGGVQALTVDASGSYLLAGTTSGLSVYAIQADGTLNLVNQAAPAPAGSYSSIATSTAIN